MAHAGVLNDLWSPSAESIQLKRSIEASLKRLDETPMSSGFLEAWIADRACELVELYGSPAKSMTLAVEAQSFMISTGMWAYHDLACGDAVKTPFVHSLSAWLLEQPLSNLLDIVAVQSMMCPTPPPPSPTSSLAPPNLLMRKRKQKSAATHCAFCQNNDEDNYELWSSHPCKDEYGDVVCPILSRLVCRTCGQTGTAAHTARYCPLRYEMLHRRLAAQSAKRRRFGGHK